MAGKDVIVPIHMQHRHADPDGNRCDEAVNQCTDGLTGKTALTIKHGRRVSRYPAGIQSMRSYPQGSRGLPVSIVIAMWRRK